MEQRGSLRLSGTFAEARRSMLKQGSRSMHVLVPAGGAKTGGDARRPAGAAAGGAGTAGTAGGLTTPRKASMTSAASGEGGLRRPSATQRGGGAEAQQAQQQAPHGSPLKRAQAVTRDKVGGGQRETGGTPGGTLFVA